MPAVCTRNSSSGEDTCSALGYFEFKPVGLAVGARCKDPAAERLEGLELPFTEMVKALFRNVEDGGGEPAKEREEPSPRRKENGRVRGP